jgi:hypothetical protein
MEWCDKIGHEPGCEVLKYFSTVASIEANAERKNESEVDEIMPRETRYEIGLDSAIQSHC